jgi:hypothetical protein
MSFRWECIGEHGIAIVWADDIGGAWDHGEALIGKVGTVFLLRLDWAKRDIWMRERHPPKPSDTRAREVF